jgi:ABC-type Mn2+/Zn2+ transport system permease subunit
MIDALTDPLATGIGTRALIELALLGAVCGPLGVWVVLYRQSYAAESISHGMLPGLVLAALAGVPLGLGAAAGLALAAAAIAAASRRVEIGADTAVAVVVTTLFGAGALLALTPEAPVRLGELLFGDPLSVSRGDLAASAGLAAVAAAVMAYGFRPLALGGFDPQSARSLGASPALAPNLLVGLLALTILVAVQALGNLLVVAIVVGPATAALRLSDRLGTALVAAAALAIGAGIAGFYLSFHAELAAGASIALCAIATFPLAVALRRPGSRPSRGVKGTRIWV